MRSTPRALPAVALAASVVVGCVTQLVGVPPATASPADDCTPPPPVAGVPGFAMQAPVARCTTSSALVASPLQNSGPPADPPAPGSASYSHAPAPNSSNDLSPGSGPVMTSLTLYFDFWLPSGQQYESTSAGDTNYENLLIGWAQNLSVASSQYHNLLTQYSGTNGTIGNNVAFGGSWVDTATPYPHAGTTADPLQDGDIQTEVHNAATTNGWAEDGSHMIVVFTATGIQECDSAMGTCTSTGGGKGYCAYHSHFSDGGNDAIYGFLGFDNFTHVSGYTCVAGDTSNDTDPNRNVYPNHDVNADAEISTTSHEVAEAETDPHPNATWTGSLGEIGDGCNFIYTPRSDIGADVYLNGHPYVMQELWSNAVHTCAMDLPTNSFCPGSVSSGVCSPTTTFAKSVDNASPQVDSTINYTLTLDNTNDSAAETNLAVSDALPPGYAVSVLSAPAATSSSFTSGSVTVDYDYLAVHQSRTITVTATVPEQAGATATNCGGLAGSDLLGDALAPLTTSPCAITAPVKIPTSVVYTGATTSDFNDPATVSAKLTDDLSNPISGKTLDFTLNGTEMCSGTTDGSGKAVCTITPGEAAGTYTLTAAYSDTSDPKYATSSTPVPFTVTKEETTTVYTGPTVILTGGSGVTLSGQLLEDGATPISGRSLTLSVGSQSCVATTLPSGIGTCTLVYTGSLGSIPLSAGFAGDAYYLPSSDTSHTAIVFAFPGYGAFALGDLTVASSTPLTTTTWWGHSWRTANSLSGGSAPAAFKGFALHVDLPATSPPTACPSSWTTTPGDSPHPAAAVPSYMGVLVTGKVTRSGSTIGGNVVHVVVVKTDAGYAADAGNPGTGTIVATYC
jgi:uncharacterized repeat protein (TIGR01451 family)